MSSGVSRKQNYAPNIDTFRRTLANDESEKHCEWRSHKQHEFKLLVERREAIECMIKYLLLWVKFDEHSPNSKL